MKRAGVAVTTRPIRYRKETIQDGEKETIVTTPQEKGIDVRFALDIISLVRKQADHTFLEAMEVSRTALKIYE